MVALANGEVGRYFLLASSGDRGEAAGSSGWSLQGGLCVVAFLSLDITGLRGKHPCSMRVSVWFWFSSSISGIHGVRDFGVLDSG